MYTVLPIVPDCSVVASKLPTRPASPTRSGACPHRSACPRGTGLAGPCSFLSRGLADPFCLQSFVLPFLPPGMPFPALPTVVFSTFVYSNRARHAAWPSGKDSLVPFMTTVYGSVTPSSKEVHKGRDQDRKDGPQEDWSGT